MLLRRPPPVTAPEPAKIRPVESFNPNIYRASMGDGLIPSVGQKGAQLDEWNSGGEALYGRRMSVVSYN